MSAWVAIQGDGRPYRTLHLKYNLASLEHANLLQMDPQLLTEIRHVEIEEPLT
jgi:hypothetical protein